MDVTVKKGSALIFTKDFDSTASGDQCLPLESVFHHADPLSL